MNKLDYACTYAFVHAGSAVKNAGRKLKERSEKVVRDESGMEVIAIVLILIVVIALIVVFKDYISDFMVNIWKKIFKEGEEVGVDNPNTEHKVNVKNILLPLELIP